MQESDGSDSSVPLIPVHKNSSSYTSNLLRRERRPAKEFVFNDELTLAIDFATSTDTRPAKWYQKLVPKGGDSKKLHPSMYDLEVVKLHLPHLLERRNASDALVKVTPELVKQNYEQAVQTERHHF